MELVIILLALSLLMFVAYRGFSVILFAPIFSLFAVYPFAAKLFRQANIPKRLIPGTIVLGAVTFTMDALPGSPQIQNVIPTTFFKTDIYAAPILGIIGAIFVLTLGLIYLESRRKKAKAAGEGYFGFEDGGSEMAASLVLEQKNHTALQSIEISRLQQVVAFIPLILVGVMNKVFTITIPKWYPNGFDFSSIGMKAFGKVELSAVLGIWSVELALIIGIITTLLLYWKRVVTGFQAGLNTSIGGALLATMNTGAEFGFGGVIAALPGFAIMRDSISATFTNPLVNGAVTTNILAGITGSASGGMGIVLSAMGDKFIAAAEQYHIPLEVMHRIVSMASGGMDTLPHNGAIITILTVTGLTHKQSYRDIFAVTILKTIAVFLVIAVYTFTGIY